MSVLKLFTNYLTVFFFFGLAPFRAGTVLIKLKMNTYLLPVIISSMLNVTVYGFLLYLNRARTFGPINSILSAGSLLTGMILNLSAIFQCCFYPTVYQHLIYRINKIEVIFGENFTVNLPSSSFANRYRLKVLVIFSFAIINGALMTVVMCHFLKSDGIPVGVLETIKSCFTAVILIHAILYIDVAQMCLSVLNLNIKDSPVCSHSTRKIEFMKYIKLMHMDTWKLVMQINDFFSWSLLFFTINFMINLIYDLYKIFRVLQTGESFTWASGNLFLRFWYIKDELPLTWFCC